MSSIAPYLMLLSEVKNGGGGGGGGLPIVTSDDNGDVLTVANGVWGKASLPEIIGGAYDFELVYTIDPDTEEISSCDKTYDEIAVLVSGSSKRAKITLYLDVDGDIIWQDVGIYDCNIISDTTPYARFLPLGSNVLANKNNWFFDYGGGSGTLRISLFDVFHYSDETFVQHSYQYQLLNMNNE